LLYNEANYKKTCTLLNKEKIAFKVAPSVWEDFEKKSEFEIYVSEQINEFIDYLKYKHYSPVTINTYSNLLRLFLLRVKKEADTVTLSDIEWYNKKYIIEKNFSISYQNQLINAIKLFFVRNRGVSFNIEQLERPRGSEYLPTILSKEEIKLIFNGIDNLKHKTILSLIYSSGLRIGETLRLKVGDIDSKRNVIIIRQSKGYKDRIVGLSPKILELLRSYYKAYRPKEYLFEGQGGGMYTSTSVRRFFKRAVQKAGIKKPVRVHNLRHSYATHLLESGTDIRYIQNILGHKDPKTTMIYTHVSNRDIKKIVSPFDLLDD
jgi:integrase/recombinase XerD